MEYSDIKMGDFYRIIKEDHPFQHHIAQAIGWKVLDGERLVSCKIPNGSVYHTHLFDPRTELEFDSSKDGSTVSDFDIGDMVEVKPEYSHRYNTDGSLATPYRGVVNKVHDSGAVTIFTVENDLEDYSPSELINISKFIKSLREEDEEMEDNSVSTEDNHVMDDVGFLEYEAIAIIDFENEEHFQFSVQTLFKLLGEGRKINVINSEGQLCDIEFDLSFPLVEKNY